MQNYKELAVWQEAMNVAEIVYGLIKRFPHYEQYALADQMRRASVSIPSNIAEGMQRLGKDQLYFFRIASGSATELETQLLLAQRFGYIHDIDHALLVLNKVMRMLTWLKRKTRIGLP